MKKLVRKGTVHPSPPVVSDRLSFLPAAILTLAAALSPEDREVLAYLLLSNNSCHVSSNPRRSSSSCCSSFAAPAGVQRNCLPSKTDHPPTFSCDCFSCYMSYWVQWDSSPNRQLIHEIIDQFEDGLLKSNNKDKASNPKTKKDRKKSTRSKADSRPPPTTAGDLKGFTSEEGFRKDDDSGISFSESSAELSTSEGGGDISHTTVTCGRESPEEGTEKGSVRKLVSLIGERIWRVWI